MDRVFNRFTLASALFALAAGALLFLDTTGKIEARALLVQAKSPAYRLTSAWRELNESERAHAAMAEELARRSMRLARAEELKRENDALRAVLGLDVGMPYQLTYGRVVERRPETWLRTAAVDVGARDGVRVGMPVVGTEGLVGKVSRVTPAGAEVELVTSERLRIAVIHNPTGAAAVYYADAAGGGALAYLPRTTDLHAGDAIVTAGTSRAFPPGLVVGYVDTFRRPFDSMFAEATVTPAEDPGALEFVFIVKWLPRDRR